MVFCWDFFLGLGNWGYLGGVGCESEGIWVEYASILEDVIGTEMRFTAPLWNVIEHALHDS